MLNDFRENDSQWLSQSLATYYPIAFIDCVHMKIHREQNVQTETFYVMLTMCEDQQREAQEICNKPTEYVLE